MKIISSYFAAVYAYLFNGLFMMLNCNGPVSFRVSLIFLSNITAIHYISIPIERALNTDDAGIFTVY